MLSTTPAAEGSFPPDLTLTLNHGEMPPVGNRSRNYLCDLSLDAVAHSVAHNEIKKPNKCKMLEAIQGQASALQGNAKEMELILLMREKWLITVIPRETSQGEWRHPAEKLSPFLQSMRSVTCCWITSSRKCLAGDFCHNSDRVLISRGTSWWKHCEDPADHFSSALGSCCPRRGKTWPKQVPAYRTPPHWPSGLKMWEYWIFYEKHFKNVWDFFCCCFWKKEFSLNFGYTGFLQWHEPLENEWSSGDSDNIQAEQLSGRRQGCLSTAFFPTLTSYSRWGSIKTQQPWKHRIESKAPSILMRQTILLSLPVYWCWVRSKPKEKDSERIY